METQKTLPPTKSTKRPRTKPTVPGTVQAARLSGSGRNAHGTFTGAVEIPKAGEASAMQLCFLSLLPT